jgi:hypothetical protein
VSFVVSGVGFQGAGAAELPLRDMKVGPFGADHIQILLRLLQTSFDTAELSRLVAGLSVISAIRMDWNSSTEAERPQRLKRPSRAQNATDGRSQVRPEYTQAMIEK